MLMHQIHLKSSSKFSDRRHLLTLLKRYLVVSALGALLLAGLHEIGVSQSASLTIIILLLGWYVVTREHV